MNRRQLIQSLGLISTHTLFPSVLTSFLASCAHKEIKEYTNHFFTEEEMKTIIEVVDIIIPPTTTLSASQTNTHLFLDQLFEVCLTVAQQKIIKRGLLQLAKEWGDVPDKTLYLIEIDKKAYHGEDSAAYFKTIKQYTLVGFFTSQEGTTKASNYVKVPEAYQGEIPADENTLNYGKTNLTYYL